MDDPLKKALDFSNYRQTLAVQRKVLKEKVDAKLTYGHAGGIFKINRELISFVQMLIDQGRTRDIPLLDINNTPVLVVDLEAFKDDILSRYFETLYEYFEQDSAIKKQRSVEKLVDL